MAEPIIRAEDIAWARMRSPDLDKQEEFLTNFGMTRAARTNDKLFMRGTDPDHHLHVTEKGDPKVVGLAFYADSVDDLKRLSKMAPGASEVEDIDEPGGGKRVRLTEPNGYQIEIVTGIEKVAPLKAREAVLNWGDAKYRRAGDLMRLDPGPSHVKRCGHGVFGTPKLKESIAWIRHHIGLIGSDDVYAGDKDNVILSFNRINRGKEYVDHHVFLYVQAERAGFNHVSFEVQDIDDVVIGHEHLKGLNKYEHMWGLGRHVLGSQIYDYWCDPWGRVHEHWTDTDVLNVDYGSRIVAAEEGLRSQWGEGPPDRFIHHLSA